MLTQHLQKLRHAVNCTENIPTEVQTSAKCAIIINELHLTMNNLIQSHPVLQETLLLKLIYKKINRKHSANHNECAEIFFSTAQGTQARMLAINTSFFTQNHVKQVVAEKE